MTILSTNSSPTRQVEVAIEGETTWFDSLTPDLLPRPLPKGIRVRFNGRQYGLEVDGLAGTLSLTDGGTIRIEPKVGDANFLRMLLVANGDQRSINQFLAEAASYSTGEEATPVGLVAARLFDRADAILRRSVQWTSTPRLHRGAYVEGAVDVIGTIRNFQQRLNEPVLSMKAVRTKDLPENRLLAKALVSAFDFVPDEARRVADITLHRWLNHCEPSQNLQADLRQVQRKLASRAYRGPRGYYEEPLRLALVALGFAGLSLVGEDEISADAALMNTSYVFEEYVRAIVRRGHSPFGYVVTKGSGDIALYVDGSYGLFPDIVLSKNGEAVLLADAKYKNPGASDHYQMSAYLTQYEVGRGVLVCPGGDKLVEPIKAFKTAQNLSIFVYPLPLTDLAEAERHLSRLVNDIPT